MTLIENADAFQVVTRLHNQPPDPIQVYIEDLQEEAAPLLVKSQELLGFKSLYDTKRPELENDDQCGKATELVKELGKLVGLKGAFELLRKKQQKPLEDGVKAIRAMSEKWTSPLASFEGEMRGRINRYQTRKLEAERAQQRRQQEEAAKIAAQGTPEAIQQAAEVVQAIAPPKAQTRSDHGSMATTRSVWKGDVTDAALVPLEFCSPDPAKIAAAIKAGTRTIPGVNIFEHIQTVIR